MTECCNDFGNCTQGRDCPIRKKLNKELDDAYIRGTKKVETNLYDETVGEFKSLLALLIFIVGLVMLAFAIWGKP